MEYRREIDGLRALAVLPVILFHAGFQTFSGGFVGVDVFFVISGYLITSIILAELEQGKFSIINFYERRARRILPALFLVMFACLPFAWFWLLPSDMKSFSQSLVAVSFFASNILFWMTSGYFDTAAELKPLLHTWSLAVEEQYYVLFPIFLLLTWRLGKRWILALLSVLFFVSLAAAQWGAYTHPAFTFLLLPTRGWELLIGVFVSFYLADRREKINQSINQSNNQTIKQSNNQTIKQSISIIGLLLITYAVFSFDKNTPFPSLYALIPTCGAAFIILFAEPKTLVGKLLGSKPFVGVGLISYSAYLWHQPLFAFARLRSVEEPNKLVFCGLAIASVFLAVFSWKFVETPFRNRIYFNRQKIFLISAFTSCVFIFIGFIGHLNRGYPSRFTEDQLSVLAFTTYAYQDIYRQGSCFLESEQTQNAFTSECQAVSAENAILIWGDSHAAALSFGFRKVLPNVIQYTASGCPPIIDEVVSWRPKCKDINDFVSNEISRQKPSRVILHANWSLYADQKPTLNLQKTIDFIRVKSPLSKITIIGGVPQYKPSLPVFMFLNDKSLLGNSLLESYIVGDLNKLDNLFADLARRNEVSFFSAIQALCSDTKCQATASYNNVTMPTAWDYGHLTEAGSFLLAEKIVSK